MFNKVKCILAALVVLTFVGCGGGGGGGDSNAGLTGTTIVTPNPTTAVLSNNMAANYGAIQGILATDMQSCKGQYTYSPSAGITSCYIPDIQNEWTSFLNTTYSNIQTVAASQSIDKTALASLVAQYEGATLGYINTNIFGGTWSVAEVDEMSSLLAPSVNAAYSNFLLKLNAL